MKTAGGPRRADKFSNVIGRIAADLVLDGTTEFNIDFLSLERFTSRSSAGATARG